MTEFAFETSIGRLEAQLSPRGELKVFVVDASDKATLFWRDLVGDQAQLAESLERVGITEIEARWHAAQMWSDAKPTPGRWIRVRRFFLQRGEPGPPPFDSGGG